MLNQHQGKEHQGDQIVAQTRLLKCEIRDLIPGPVFYNSLKCQAVVNIGVFVRESPKPLTF